jgi:exopolysaccharide biosynthesis polyprenyl glycosylphosphotransferase
MNGTAARRSQASATSPWGSPLGRVAGAGLLEAGNYAARPGVHRKWGGPVVQTTYAAIDVLLVCVGGVIVFLLRFGLENPLAAGATSREPPLHRIYLHGYPGFLLLYCGLIVLACISENLYRTPREITSFVESMHVAKAVVLATTLLVLFIFTSGNREISRLVVSSAGALNVLLLAGWRYAKRQYMLHRATRGKGLSRILIIGAGQLGQAFASWIECNRHLGYTFCGFVDPHPNGDKRVLGSLRDLRTVALAQFADELFIAPPADAPMVKEAFLEARRLRLPLHVLPDLYEGLAWRAPLHYVGGFPVLNLHGEPIPAFGLAAKRAMDILVSSLGLALCSPLLALAALWIRLDSPGPVIYSALRVGKKGRKFRCYKLRTMVASADAQKESLRASNERHGPFFKMGDDPRVTGCGKWLRRFSVDELPQLMNVLLGDMSLVGPRPHPLDDYERYTIEHLRRLDVKPGITGLWQVKARHDPSFDATMVLDLEYIENWNLWRDCKILLRTVPIALRGDGR